MLVLMERLAGVVLCNTVLLVSISSFQLLHVTMATFGGAVLSSWRSVRRAGPEALHSTNPNIRLQTPKNSRNCVFLRLNIRDTEIGCVTIYTILASRNTSRPFVLQNLCKFCDARPSACNSSGICMSHCTITSICKREDEVCASAWYKEGQNVTLETVCHSPSVPFHGVLLDDYKNTNCIMKQYMHLGLTFFICSCSSEECNHKLIFSPHHVGSSGSPPVISAEQVFFAIFVSMVVLVILLVTFVYVCKVCLSVLKPTYNESRSILTDKLGHTISISNQFNHNTELLPIHLEKVVGKGRFAEVHRAHLGPNTNITKACQVVGVKIFAQEEFLSWRVEREILMDTELHHQNILHFLAAEERPQVRQFWLVTAYHARGNLQDYLRVNQVKWTELCRMGGDIARGVAHLHSDRTEKGIVKVPIVHRDLKSDNVLVKEDLSCCICDFGLSIRLNCDMSKEALANQGQVGTVRYMAPEVLESRLNLEGTESFKQADVYSLALVLWEITSRCSSTGEVREYQLPFGKLSHPCIESMKDTVIRDRERPEIHNSWRTHKGVVAVCEMIVECWDEDPEARLTAHCVTERFKELNNASFICNSKIKIMVDHKE